MRLVLLLSILAGCDNPDDNVCEECPDLAIRCAKSDAGAGKQIITIPFDGDGGIPYCRELCLELAPVHNVDLTLICGDLEIKDGMRTIECDYLLCS